MSWAEVFKINENTKNVVEDNICLVASENVYAVFPDSIMYNTILTKSDICSITLPHGGSMNLKCRVGSRTTLISSGESSGWVYLDIHKNGQLYTSISGQYEISSASDKVVTLAGQKGDVFKLSVRTVDGSRNIPLDWARIYLYELLATPLPSTAVTITVL